MTETAGGDPTMDLSFVEELWNETPDAILAIAPDDSVLFWNRAAEATFGYERAEAVGAKLDDLIIPLDRLDDERLMRVEVTARNRAVYESLRRRKDGSLLHVGVSSKALKDADGNLRFVVSTQKDITDLKVLRDAKCVAAKFGDLLESIPEAIVIVNATGRIVLTNVRAELLFGYGRGELAGRPFDVLLPACGRGRLEAGHAGQVPCGVRKNGEEFPVEINMSRVDTEERDIVMSAIRAVTDRKQAHDGFNVLLDSSPDAIIIVGPRGEISHVNRQVALMFGYEHAELLGQAVEFLLPLRYRKKHPAQRSNSFDQPRPHSMREGLQLFGLRKDGSEFPVEISLGPIQTKEGVFVVGAIRDATGRRRVEYELHEVNRLKSEFLANMSHELRTPLNGIIGFSEFLIDGKPGSLNEKQKEYLGDVLSSGLQLLQLINDILDLTKIESGKMELHPETFETELAIDEVCSVLFPLVRKRSITIRREVAADARSVTLDRRKFMQVLHNLLSNGVKFNYEGGEIRILVDLEGPGSLRLRVCDFGIGIDPSDFPKLFVEFQQLDSSAKRRFGGTGLGLALTKKIVEFQGGRIDVESELGIGSTFTVTLPLLDRGAMKRAELGVVA